MEDKQYHLLVVDDEEDLCEILQFNLESQGYQVDTANSAEEAMELPLKQYHLILLDVMMGGISGFHFAEKLKKDRGLNTPVIFLTAKDSENDLITGFNLGADDYLAKPFSINELSLRIKAVIRRSIDQVGMESQNIQYQDMILDIDKKVFRGGDSEYILTRKEFEILMLLMKNKGRIFTREEILYRVWHDEVIVSERTVDVHMTRLRKKIGPYGSHIRNKTGYGYYFELK